MSFKPQDSINGDSKEKVQRPVEMEQPPSTRSMADSCPFIGLRDDPSTRLLFASPAACCHRADPVDAVDMSHQQAYCLTSVHKICPVFTRPDWSPLPSEIAYHRPAAAPPRNRWIWVVVALVLVGLIAGVVFAWNNGRSSTNVLADSEADVPIAAIVATETPSPTVTVAASSTMAATPSATATIVVQAVASSTPKPTNTSTPRPTATVKPSATATDVPTVTASATLVPTYTPVPSLTPVLVTPTAVPLANALVTVPFLNVRSGPSTEYELLATVAEGDELELTGRILDGDWWQICCINGEPGWVIAEAVDIPENAETIVPVVTAIPALPTPQP